MSRARPRTNPSAAELAARAAGHSPAVSEGYWAATALVLADGPAGAEVLFIRRLVRAGDRWSGDMALPGGKRDPGDRDAAHTAARETWEETRVHVTDPVARLDDQHGRAVDRVVAAVAFTVEGRPDPVPEPAEVEEAMWIPVSALADPANQTSYRYRGVVPFPSITVGRHEIWGLTHRIVTGFLHVAGVVTP